MTAEAPQGRAAASPKESEVWAALDRVLDPDVRRPITDLGMVPSVQVDDTGAAEVEILLTIAGCPAAHSIEAEVNTAVAAVAGVTEQQVRVGVMDAQQRQEFITRVRGSKPQQFGPDSLTRVIAVTSGKGGVGKSSLTVALAVALRQRGFTVGIIDADIFGFSIPAVLGLSRAGDVVQPTRVGDMIMPPQAAGVQAISIGMFLGDADPRSTAVSWRGPMLHRTIEQFLRDVWFGDLDFLLLDLPPGTGDIAISVGQLLPQAEVVVITTPQEAAADVAVRSALVARQTGQRVIGVIENMAGFIAPDGTLIELFGSGGGQAVADRLSDDEHGSVPLLGTVPLSTDFRAAGDAGTPDQLVTPDDPAGAAVLSIAERIANLGRGLAGRSLGVRVGS